MPSHVELRKLPPATVFELSKILDLEEGWKQLMAVITMGSDKTPKYTVEHIKLIECAGEKQKRSCTEILLEEWGTSGQRRPKLPDLLNFLLEAQLFRAAEFVAVHLLKQEPPKRPTDGPAAAVDIPEMAPLPSAPPMSSSEIRGSENLYETTPLLRKNPWYSEVEALPHVRYEELERGTQGFRESRRLGSGGFGSVYLCCINNEKIAVKRLHDPSSAVQKFQETQFQNELNLLSGIRHRNLLPLLGYSSDGPFRCLVYSYMANGSLEDAIAIQDDGRVLSWIDRYKIAMGAANGLQHLHTCGTKPLVHRDVKSANILLDDQLIPKVGDYGLVRLGSMGGVTSVMTSVVVGTSAYMAPEAHRGDVSSKGDVYSFGVVLLEMVTGQPPYDENREGCDLVSYIEEVEVIDTVLDRRPKEENETIARGLYSVAEKCLLDKKNRPLMSTVIRLLGEIPSQSELS